MKFSEFFPAPPHLGATVFRHAHDQHADIVQPGDAAHPEVLQQLAVSAQVQCLWGRERGKMLQKSDKNDKKIHRELVFRIGSPRKTEFLKDYEKLEAVGPIPSKFQGSNKREIRAI